MNYLIYQITYDTDNYCLFELQAVEQIYGNHAENNVIIITNTRHVSGTINFAYIR